jgi:hypothetical protein
VTGLEFAKASLILPIGISFYTFELVSYLVDRLRGTAPRYSFRVFGLFIALFPHLIAGPIMRHNEIIPQFSYDPLRTGLYERIGRGLILFLIGFIEKFFIADQLAPIVDPVFAAAAREVPTLSQAAAGSLAFSLQIFFDFAAYSNMAMGIGLMFGFMLPVNFDVPYRAVNLRDFWRRWHITLSRCHAGCATMSTFRLAAAARAWVSISGRRWLPWACAGYGTAPAGPSSCGVWGTASGSWCAVSGRVTVRLCRRSPPGRSRSLSWCCCSCCSAPPI